MSITCTSINTIYPSINVHPFNICFHSILIHMNMIVVVSFSQTNDIIIKEQKYPVESWYHFFEIEIYYTSLVHIPHLKPLFKNSFWSHPITIATTIPASKFLKNPNSSKIAILGNCANDCLIDVVRDESPTHKLYFNFKRCLCLVVKQR